MKRQWDIEDLIEHFTLVEDDLKILANKTGGNALGLRPLAQVLSARRALSQRQA